MTSYFESISNTMEDVVYAFRAPGGSAAPFKDGKISLIGGNLLLLFAGLFLLEERLESEDAG